MGGILRLSMAGWLDMVEIEIGVMCRMALGSPFADVESFKRQVQSWTLQRNAQCARVNWQFTTKMLESN